MLTCSSAAQKPALLLQGQRLPHVESSTRLARHRGHLEGLPGAGTPSGVGRDRWEMAVLAAPLQVLATRNQHQLQLCLVRGL